MDGDRGKSFGKCGNCGVVLKNTSVQRMANHRRRCGASLQGPSREIQKLVQTKIEDEIVDQEHEEMMWSSPTHLEEYVEEPAPIPVEKVNRTAMEIINEDISRHTRRSSKAKRHSTSQSIDTALSSFLIGCNLTFDIVDSTHFKNFANSLNSTYTIPSSTQLKARVISQLQSMESEERYKPIKKRRHYETSESESE